MYTLFLKYGMPKFSTEYAQRLVPDPVSMDLFLSVVLLMNKPYLTSMSPVLIKAFMTFTPRVLAVSAASVCLCVVSVGVCVVLSIPRERDRD